MFRSPLYEISCKNTVITNGEKPGVDILRTYNAPSPFSPRWRNISSPTNSNTIGLADIVFHNVVISPFASFIFDQPIYNRGVKRVGSWIGDNMTGRRAVNYGIVNRVRSLTLSGDYALPPGVGGCDPPLPTHHPSQPLQFCMLNREDEKRSQVVIC